MATIAWAGELPLADVLGLALKQNPDVRVSFSQVDTALAQHQQSIAGFDWIVDGGLDFTKTVAPRPPSAARAEIQGYSSGYHAGVRRQLRNGAQVGVELTALATLADTAATVPQQNLTKLDVSFTIPLLKGRGTPANTAAELAAQLHIERSRYDLRERAAQALRDTLRAYWDYRARVALYAVAKDSEARARDLLASNQKLVAAAEKPRGDLVLLGADVADKAASTQAAGLALSEARRTLGRLLGMNQAEINRLPEPQDPFPAVSPLVAALSERLPALNRVALEQRADLKSLSLQIEATERQFQAAINRQKPQLDLNVGVGYGRASEGGSRYGFVSQAGRTPSEPSVFARLNYQFPLENNQAQGVAKEYAAQLAQLAIRQRDLADGIGSGVDSAVQAMVRTATQLQAAQQSMDAYEQAVKQEIIKQKNGIATLIDVINVEARFVSARVNVLQLQLAYASALARLRYETGSFFPASSVQSGERDSFALSVPDLAGLGPLEQWLSNDNGK